jgi:hypothetical protein
MKGMPPKYTTERDMRLLLFHKQFYLWLSLKTSMSDFCYLIVFRLAIAYVSHEDLTSAFPFEAEAPLKSI